MGSDSAAALGCRPRIELSTKFRGTQMHVSHIAQEPKTRMKQQAVWLAKIFVLSVPNWRDSVLRNIVDSFIPRMEL